MPFPIDNFLSMFPEFANEKVYKRPVIMNYGRRAMFHIGHSEIDMPVVGAHREYALFLMTGHLIELDKDSLSEDPESGDSTSSSDGVIAGTPFKATVGSVTVENTKFNSFTSDDWNYWLNQTKYGRELLAYLETQALGVFLNTPADSVRDLL